MSTQFTVDADLAFSIQLPGASSVSGHLTGSGNRLELQVDRPFVFAGRSDSAAVMALARGLAAHRLTLTVTAPDGPLVTLGVARSSWWQRRVTGSRHIRIDRVAALWALVRSRIRAPADGVFPTSTLLPPPTLLPVAPTWKRPRRQRVTTTHDPSRGGRPRLFLSLGEHPRAEDTQKVFSLRDDVTVIGSGPASHVRLDGLALSHAEVVHDDRDEFVLRRTDGAKAQTRVNGEPVDEGLLRTGTGVTLGAWSMLFYREEYADHGRPYGGRIGGELGHQRAQPSRSGSRREQS